jgi:hypothetical protein
MITYYIKDHYFSVDSEVVPGSCEFSYSGNGKWKNDPASCGVKDHGPIPAGEWTATPASKAFCATHGPWSLKLTPVPETDTYGRSGFYIHGDWDDGKQDASDGCIITDRGTRQILYTEALRDPHLIVKT